MKIITKFKAEDGAEFDTSEKALAHEAICRKVQAVQRLLPSAVDEGCEFSNGGGFIQQTESDLRAFDEAMIDLLAEIDPKCHALYLQNPKGNAGAYLEDHPVYEVLMRRYCIDAQNREWGQPYYANNPTVGKQIAALKKTDVNV